MPGTYNAQIAKSETTASREIKASAHYTYIESGATLDGSKFAANSLVVEGTCLVRDKVTKKLEPYKDDGGDFPAGKDLPLILDTSVRINGDQDDMIVGALLIHGAVHEGMLVGVTEAFKQAVGGAIRFV